MARQIADAETGTHVAVPSSDRVSEVRLRPKRDDSDASRVAETTRLRAEIRARDDALAVVAHDLRNPLNVITLAANAIAPSICDASVKLQMDRLMRATHRAERLVKDLLDVSAIEIGCFTVYTDPTDTADLILSALDSQHALAAESSVILSTDIAPDLPPVDVDADRLLQVFENLVGNALKFTHAGGNIVIGAANLEHKVLCWVKDDGRGMPAAQLPHLFDRFWHARKPDRRGPGLGLTICKGIVEAHGGKIWAHSQEGEGTTMFFTIPVSGCAEAVAASQVANILIVSRDANDTLSLYAMLDSARYRVMLARNGQEALELARQRPFSMALIDIASGVQGLDVARWLKDFEHSRHIPIVFLTAVGAEPEEIHRAYFAGGVDYISKPFNREVVRKKVAMLAGLAQRRRTSHPAPADHA